MATGLVAIAILRHNIKSPLWRFVSGHWCHIRINFTLLIVLSLCPPIYISMDRRGRNSWYEGNQQDDHRDAIQRGDEAGKMEDKVTFKSVQSVELLLNYSVNYNYQVTRLYRTRLSRNSFVRIFRSIRSRWNLELNDVIEKHKCKIESRTNTDDNALWTCNEYRRERQI